MEQLEPRKITCYSITFCLVILFLFIYEYRFFLAILIFLLLWNVHKIKFTILTIFRCAVQ